ncbi:hypothetical protein M231_06393 [Tremella mesenterica]|uniref:Uncharacterized protein n=1 Tax=Tremella mesenterica TaxID=5217 RepID=A0A4Q1BE04_TREME|nr:hypothetical protein M231_06393 [Tremella mesenterica]
MSSTTSETLSLLPQFLSLLNSSPLPFPLPSTSSSSPSSSLPIPPDTLYGGITHFLTSLPLSNLPEFIQTLISSPLWVSNPNDPEPSIWTSSRLRNLSESVSQAPILLTQDGNSRKTRKEVKKWLNIVGNEILKIQPHLFDEVVFPQSGISENSMGPKQYESSSSKFVTPDSIGVVQMMRVRDIIILGLLRGLNQSSSINWGKMKDKLENESVVNLSQSKDLWILCETVEVVEDRKLLLLDWKDRLHSLEKHLLSMFSNSPTPPTLTDENVENSDMEEEIPLRLAKTMSKMLMALSRGEERHRVLAWDCLDRWTDFMLCLGRELEKSQAKEGVEMKIEVLILLSSTILDILLDPSRHLSFTSAVTLNTSHGLGRNTSTSTTDHRDSSSESYPTIHSPNQTMGPPTSRWRTANVCLKFLEVLASIPKRDTLEYTKLLYGSLDLAESSASPQEITHLLRRLMIRPISEEKKAFVLTLGEQLVHCLDADGVKLILTLTEECLRSPEKETFQAAHAFILALIQSASSTLESKTDQKAFFEAILKYYALILIKQCSKGRIPTDDFISAYVILVQSASRSSDTTHIYYLNDLLDTVDERSMIKTKIAILPHVPIYDLVGYLDKLGKSISTTGHTPENHDGRRAENRSVGEGVRTGGDEVGELFKVISGGLSDEGKQIGMKWWFTWQRGNGGMRARL